MPNDEPNTSSHGVLSHYFSFDFPAYFDANKRMQYIHNRR
jgi:hypothetical protein